MGCIGAVGSVAIAPNRKTFGARCARSLNAPAPPYTTVLGSLGDCQLHHRVLDGIESVARVRDKPQAVQRAWSHPRDARLKFEINSTDGDGGVQVFIDAEEWKTISIFAPQGNRIFSTGAEAASPDSAVRSSSSQAGAAVLQPSPQQASEA